MQPQPNTLHPLRTSTFRKGPTLYLTTTDYPSKYRVPSNLSTYLDVVSSSNLCHLNSVTSCSRETRYSHMIRWHIRSCFSLRNRHNFCSSNSTTWCPTTLNHNHNQSWSNDRPHCHHHHSHHYPQLQSNGPWSEKLSTNHNYGQRRQTERHHSW